MQEIRLQLAKEHEAWRGLIATLSRALGEGRVDTAVTTLDSLAQRFRRSVRDEEERILPAFEQVTGVAALSRAPRRPARSTACCSICWAESSGP